MTNLTKSIIVEGPNGSGKSTLVSVLHNKFPFVRVVHATRPIDHYTAVSQAYSQYHVGLVNPGIFDRSHAISRLIYQHHTINPLERSILVDIAKFQARDTTIIYCTGKGPRDTNKPHYSPELIIETEDRQEEICFLYDDLMDSLIHQEFNFEKDDISCLQLD